ncbi:hypothetical protein [Tabrizicola sp.]|uniref:hypothetical protein n=1 Tax=Tabrizicola sp. TaxID=2005166 RepID=UPI0035AD896A
MSDALIEEPDQGNLINLRIDGPNPNFRLATERITASALAPLDPVVEDLLHIASAVFFADSTVRRGGGTRPQMGVSWRRNFRITVQVFSPDLWSRSEVVSALEDAMGFLTEDRYEFRFDKTNGHGPAQGLLDLDPKGAAFRAEEVILFSGGLDSFAGALEALSTSGHNVLLVSHRSAQKVVPRQDHLAAYLRKQHAKRFQHIKVIARRDGPEASETTQRSRSFLFAALGLAVARSFGASRVNFYENGIVSHNLPISPQIIGTMATRTTHPLVLAKLNRLFELVLPGAAKLSNPYEWLTKTEVIQRIAQFGGKSQISSAVSCTSVRDQTKLHPHCGKCSQCLDRRFGILAAGLGADDPPDQYKTDVLLGERTDDGTVKMAVEWTRHALHLQSLDKSSFFAKFGLELSRILQGHPELPSALGLERILSLHQRHSESVLRVLKEAVENNALALAELRLPASSLLMLHLGSSALANERTIPRDPRIDERPSSMPKDIPEEDLQINPDDPLVVAFYTEGDRHVVSVRGLMHLVGQSARVPHALKPTFDEDRSHGLRPEGHRYVNDLRALNWTKETVRKNVERCRAELAASYLALFGFAPPAPLLVQSKQRQGYRLDPLIKLTDRRD